MNNTFRLFVSSTFSDFIKERAILNNEIFEKIRAFLKRKGCGFQIVDLRWGINTESALNQNTLEICLEEINYCIDNSPKPNFLIMAGERYGWVPLPSKVEASEFEKILDSCDDPEKELLRKWYLVDKNNTPEIYYLKRRSGEYRDDGVWFGEEERLHAILEKRAKECGFDEVTLTKYTASATEHEILKGLFGNKDIADNVIVLMREGYTERDEDLAKTLALKRRIREKMEKDNLSHNIVTLEYNEEYYKLMEERVTELLIKNILTEFERLQAEKNEYIPEKLPEGMFCGREKDLEYLKNYVESDEKGVLFLSGDSGSGKTTLIKEFIHFCNEYDPTKIYDEEMDAAEANKSIKELLAATKRYVNKKSYDVFPVLFGEDDVYNFYDCLKKICLMIVKKYDIYLGEEINRYNIAKMFSDVFGKTPTGIKIIVVIDGIDMFYDIRDIKENIFPDVLLEDVKIVVSGADEKIVEKFIRKDDKEYRITGFSGEDAKNSFYKIMESRGRNLSSDMQKNLVEKALSDGANPLSCKLLSVLAARWRSGDLVEELDFDDIKMAKKHIVDMFENCGHDENVVRYVLSYIAVAPFGITEDDLLTLLFMHKEIKESFDKEDRYNYKLKKLPFAILSRLLYDLKECINHSMAKDSIIISFNHNVFKKVVLDEFSENCALAEDNLLKYYMDMDNYISEDLYPNAKKLMPILSLLKKKGMYEEIEKLLSDITFADAMIKSDNLTELCDSYAELAEKGLLGSKGRELFECIRNNSSTLDCYKNGLLSTALSFGIAEGRGVLKNFPSGTKSMNFDLGSDIYFSCDGEKYAVIRDEYVYIYRKNAYRNYMSVHIELNDYILKERIVSLLWTKNDKLILVSDNDEILIYDINSEIPKFDIRITNVRETKNVIYSYDRNLLLAIIKNKLTAINMETYETEYEIKDYGSPLFDINENEGKILHLSGRSMVKIYKIANGEFVKSESFRYKYADGAVCVYLFDGDIGVGIYNAFDVEAAFISGGLRKHIYFPNASDVKKLIKYKNSLVAIYEYGMVKADMVDFGLSYVSIPGLKDAYATADGCSLLSVTDRGAKVIGDGEFLPLSEKLYFTDKNIVNAKGDLMGLLTSTVKTSLKMETKRESFRALLGKDHFVFGYDLAEYNLLHDEYLKNITFMAFSGMGHIMAAFEGKGKIKVYDGEGKVICLIKDKFSLNDTIVKSEFSEDSKYLYILKTDGIIVVNVEKGKVLSRFGFNGNPPEFVEFTEGGKLAFVKGERYEFPIIGRLKAAYNRIKERRYTKEEFEGFLYPCLSGAYLGETFLYYTYLDFDYAGNYKNVYRNLRDTLVFENGVFTLNGTEFENDYCDFKAVLRDEFVKNNSKFKTFMKIKNDMSSKLIRRDEKLLLISFILNSIVVFDTVEMKVTEARKFEGEISGVSEIDDGIEIYQESYPYKIRIMF